MGFTLACGRATAQTDIFKCTLPNGRTEYQAAPCKTGQQTAIDDRNNRAERAREERLERRKVENEQQRVSDDAKLKEHLSMLKFCLEKPQCSPSSYRVYLSDKPRAFVSDALGQPTSVQDIGGRTMHYYDVPTDTGSKRGRLQVVYDGFKVSSVNIY
jgi:hypothetical protein